MNRRAHQRRLFCTFLLCAGLLSLPSARVAGGNRRPAPAGPPISLPAFEITIPPAALGLSPDGFDTITFPGYGDDAIGGAPSRPVQIFRIELPDGVRPRLQILDTEFRDLEGIDLTPAPRPAPADPAGRTGPGNGRPLHRPDSKSYGRPGWSPAQPIEIGTIGYIRHRRYAQLRVYPAQYDPHRRRLRVYSRIRFVLHPEPGRRAGRRAGVGDETGYDSIYRLGFQDGGRIDAVAPLTGEIETTATAAPMPTASSGGSPAYRLRVSRTGVYRLTYEYLNDPARAADLIALNPDPADFRLDSQGQEIPIRVENGGDPALFEAGEWIEFFGEHLAGDFLDPDIFESGDFTDTNVYRLSLDAGPRLRIADRTGTPVSGYPTAAPFPHTEVTDPAAIFFGQLPFDGAGHWYAEPFIREGPGADFFLTLNGTGTAGTAHIEVRMLGVNYVDNLHRTALAVNGTPVGVTEDWDGFVFQTQIADFDATLLVDGVNTITVVAPLGRTTAGGDPVVIDAILLDRIEVTYDRLSQAVAGALGFPHPNQDVEFQVGGIGTAASVYEITSLLPGAPLADPVRITGGSLAGSTLTFEVDQDGGLAPGAPRRFVVAAGAGLLEPDAVETDQPTDLRATTNGADWIVIGHRDLVDLSPGSALDQVMTMRQGQGLRTMVIDIQDLYDEFTFGIDDPQAIRDFLQYAFVNWTPPAPLYVVLLGDATHDMKNHFGATETRVFVPTYPRDDSDSQVLGYYADETYFSTIAGDDPIPDLLLGRVPAHDMTEAEGYWQKVLDYEIGTTGAAWESHAVFVADEGEPLFETVQDNQILGHFDGVLHTAGTVYYQDIIDANGGVKTQATADLATAEIQTAVDSGAVTVNFVGHGGFQQWSQFPNIWETLSNRVPSGATPVFDDVDALANGPRYPFMINVNCITGAFQITGAPDQPQAVDQSYSFAEDFLITPGKGLIGALAPSHLTFTFILDLVNNNLYEAMYGAAKVRRLGDLQMVLRLAFERLGMIQDLQSYVFLGDPAVQLRLPAPAPPTAVAAVAGNARVDLSWIASADAVAYNIYRAAFSPAGSYQKLNPAPLVATLYADTTVGNNASYYYAVTSVDANGFEGAWSNFNTDCAVSGPDCVRATPLNPDPPAVPTGLTAADPGTGGRVNLNWIANTEIDLQKYTLHYSTTPGLYDQTLDLGAGQTGMLLGGLVDGIPHFFALTATNTSGLTSGFSIEATATPRLLLGLAPPKVVNNLQVNPDGADLLLTWNPVTTDINGDPTVIDSYTVYANTGSADFTLAGNELVTLSGSTTTYRHPGAFSGGIDYFYLVAARDDDGLLSAAGHELPAPIFDLTIEVVGGQLQLNWNPLGVDILGNPTLISHYQLYADAAPFSRADIGPALLQLDFISNPPVLVPMPAGTRFYSVLPIDNRGTASPY